MDKNFEKRVKTAITEIGEIYKKHQIAASLNIRLPSYPRPPFLVRIALWILSRYGAIIDTLYVDLKKRR